MGQACGEQKILAQLLLGNLKEEDEEGRGLGATWTGDCSFRAGTVIFSSTSNLERYRVPLSILSDIRGGGK
jgi:hypothetical protein